MRRWLLFLLLLVTPAVARQRQEILLEHCPQNLIIPILEARFPGVHLVSHPTISGFLFDDQFEVDRYGDSIVATKQWIPLVDQPPQLGAGKATREISCKCIPAHIWEPYLHYRFPDLILSLDPDGHGFCGTGRPEQLDLTLALVENLEKPHTRPEW